MNRFRVYWWIRGVGGRSRKQGQDVVETEIDFFEEEDVEKRIREDLDACIPKLGGGTGARGVFSWYHNPEADSKDFEPNLPNFLKAHREIMKDGMVSNWGVQKIIDCTTAEKETTTK